MLDSRGIENKLWEYAAKFKVHMGAKRYAQARYCYDKARDLAVGVELEEEKREELFGVRGERGVILKEGLFREELVDKAYIETCVKAKGRPEDCILCQNKLRAAVQR